MNLRLSLAFASLTLAACAGMSANECSSADWYQVGFRDGLFGLQRRDEAYAHQCGQQNAGQPDRILYARGWQEGVWEADARRAHGGEE
jgi:hypothetical protein